MTPRRGIGAVLVLAALALLVPGVLKALGAGGGRTVDASRVAAGASTTVSLDATTYDVRQEPAGGAPIPLAVRAAGAVEDTRALALGPAASDDFVARVRVPADGRYLLTAGAGAGEVVLVEPGEPEPFGALPGLLLGAVLAWAGLLLVSGRDPRVALRRWSGASSG